MPRELYYRIQEILRKREGDALTEGDARLRADERPHPDEQSEQATLMDSEARGQSGVSTLTDDEPETLEELLDELQPFDVAHVMQHLEPAEQLQLLSLMPAKQAAETLEHLNFELQYRLLDHVGEEHARAIIAEMPVHHLVMLVNAVHPLRGQVLLELVPDEAKEAVFTMQTLPEDAAGRRISVRHFEARKGWTTNQVIAHFRKVGQNVDVTNYVYVVDDMGQFVGVASLREVLLSPDDTLLKDIMYTKVVSIDAAAEQEEAARLLNQYDFVALPVVDDEGRLMGIISADDIMDVMQEEATEDIHILGGSTPFEGSYLDTTVATLFRSRVGWLLVLFFAQSLTSTIMRNFENVLEQVIALTFFIPLLIDTAGNSGSQASTVITRAIALGEVTMKHFFTVIWREARVSILLGIVMAGVAFLRALMMGESPILGLTVATTIALVVLVGSTAGAALPLIGKRLGLDPAVFAAPLITTIADGVGLLIYFNVAVRLLQLG